MNGMGNNNNAQATAQAATVQAAQATAQMRQQVMAAPDATCGKCDGAYFENIYKVKRISAAISPNGQETIVPVQTLRCLACGNTLDDVTDFASPPTPEAASPLVPPAEPVVKTDNT